jgi:hypothetical protein
VRLGMQAVVDGQFFLRANSPAAEQQHMAAPDAGPEIHPAGDASYTSILEAMSRPSPAEPAGATPPYPLLRANFRQRSVAQIDASLFIAQRDHGIDFCGAACGNVAGKECDGGQPERNGEVGDRIAGFDAVEKRGDQAREPERQCGADY